MAGLRLPAFCLHEVAGAVLYQGVHDGVRMQNQMSAKTSAIRNRRYAPRYAVRLPASGSDGASAFEVCIRSISATGLSIEAPIELKVGRTFEIELPGAGPTPARVMWSDGFIGGCVFETPLPKAVVSATRLKGYPVSADAPVADSAPTDVLLVDEGPRWSGLVRLPVAFAAGLGAWAMAALAFSILG